MNGASAVSWFGAIKDTITTLLAVAAFAFSLVTLRRTNVATKFALVVGLASEKQAALGLIADGESACLLVLSELVTIASRAADLGKFGIAKEATSNMYRLRHYQTRLLERRAELQAMDTNIATVERIRDYREKILPSFKLQADKDRIANLFGLFITKAKDELDRSKPLI